MQTCMPENATFALETAPHNLRPFTCDFHRDQPAFAKLGGKLRCHQAAPED